MRLGDRSTANDGYRDGDEQLGERERQSVKVFDKEKTSIMFAVPSSQATAPVGLFFFFFLAFP